jgi:hypothetical protein
VSDLCANICLPKQQSPPAAISVVFDRNVINIFYCIRLLTRVVKTNILNKNSWEKCLILLM